LRATDAHDFLAQPYMQRRRALAIVGAKAIDRAVAQHRLERRALPICALARFHRVDMAIERQLRRPGAGTRHHIVNTVGTAQGLAAVTRPFIAGADIG